MITQQIGTNIVSYGEDQFFRSVVINQGHHSKGVSNVYARQVAILMKIIN